MKLNRVGGIIAAGLAMGLIAACDRRAAQNSTAPLTPSDPISDLPLAPPPPPEGSFLAQLAPAQISRLSNLGIEVVVPGAVPPSFAVADLRLDQGDDGSTSYIILYQDATNRCFAIEFATTGISAPPATEDRLPIAPPLFNSQSYGLSYGQFKEVALRDKFPGSNLYSDWLMGSSGAYRLVGAAYIGDLFPSLQGCQDLSPDEAVAMVESLTVLTPEMIGDGAGSMP